VEKGMLAVVADGLREWFTLEGKLELGLRSEFLIPAWVEAENSNKFSYEADTASPGTRL
jgi:hypothetical protein